MAKKSKKGAEGTSGATTNALTALQIGSQVRCIDDNTEGRLTWAKGVAVKINCDDGEQVTWKHGSLATKLLVSGNPPIESDLLRSIRVPD